jgi:hypothetical protein
MTKPKHDLDMLRAQTEAGYFPLDQYVTAKQDAYHEATTAYLRQSKTQKAERAESPVCDVEKLVEACWQDLTEKDDRTSPELYLDMALIKRDELAGYIADALTSMAARLAEFIEVNKDLSDENLALRRIVDDVKRCVADERERGDAATANAKIYGALLEAAGYRNIDTIKDVMNAKALGVVIACIDIGLKKNLADAEARVAVLEGAINEAARVLDYLSGVFLGLRKGDEGTMDSALYDYSQKAAIASTAARASLTPEGT